MNDSIYPLEFPASLSHPRLEEFWSTLRCHQRPFHVPMAELLMPVENCYWNVMLSVERYGGEILLGWMIKQWPGVYLAAEHHAVWRRPDGNIVDITQRFPTIQHPTTFAIDSDQSIDLQSPPNIRTRYLRLTDDSRVTNLIERSGSLNRMTMKVNRFLAEELGQTSEKQLAIARGEIPDRIPITSAQMLAYEQLVTEVRDLRLEIGEVINSLVSRPPNRTARSATRAYVDSLHDRR